MNTKLYVTSFAETMTYQEFMDLFSAHGNVVAVNLPVEHADGRPRGYGLVTMATPEGARRATLALDGKQMGTLTLSVSETVPHEDHAGLSNGGRSPRRSSSYLF